MSKDICLNYKEGHHTCETCIEDSKYYGLEGCLSCYKQTPLPNIIKKINVHSCKLYNKSEGPCRQCDKLPRSAVELFECWEPRKKYGSRQHLEKCIYCGKQLNNQQKRLCQKYCSQKCYGLSKERK